MGSIGYRAIQSICMQEIYMYSLGRFETQREREKIGGAYLTFAWRTRNSEYILYKQQHHLNSLLMRKIAVHGKIKKRENMRKNEE